MANETDTETSRTLRRFAWLPTRLDDGTWVHLDWYLAHEEWERDYAGLATGYWIVQRRTAAPE